MSIAAGLVLALASTAAISTGFFVQHQAASGLPQLSLRRPLRSLQSLFRNLRWLGGFVLGIAGWALYVGALALAPLSLVQACSAGGIGVLALLARTRVSRERVGVGLSIAGLVLLGVSLAGGADSGRAGSLTAPVVWLVVSAALAAVAVGPAARLLMPGAGLGGAAGILYAAGDVGTKSAVHGGVRLWLVPAILAAHGLAFVALQLGFQRGAPLATAGVSTLLMNSLPILAGLAVFGESLPGGPLGVLRVAAFALVVAGASALATQGTPAPAEAFG
ncbi:MAG: hypothetical protein ACYDA3_08595 [Gaiellaceae bacterium]